MTDEAVRTSQPPAPAGGSTDGSAAHLGAARPWLPALPPRILAVVFAGGCLGGVARYGLTKAWPAPQHGFPWGIFTANIAGAFALAVLVVVVTEALGPTTYLRPFLGTGVLGSWTTFSSLAAATDQLTAHAHPVTAAGYLLGSVVAGLGAAAAGLAGSRAAVRRRHPKTPVPQGES